ncbi:MAG: ChaN family lipoprotein, partial [Burkholderiaceae bacterium]
HRSIVAALAVFALAGCATSRPLDSDRLSAELARRPVVLLGEVHDNVMQHRARAEAVRKILETGARPAIAFEQFDRERQADIDRARREQPTEGRSLADHVIAQARTPKDSWDWALYRPFVELALQFDLPIVAANLSRSDATRIVRQGANAVFNEAERRELALESFNAILPRHEHIVRVGHCDLLPASALPGLARAQIARDAVLARSLRPYLERGVILLTGNGHARRDIGIPQHFAGVERDRVWAIGLLEEGTPADRDAHYDVAFRSPEQERPDPCAALKPKSG